MFLVVLVLVYRYSRLFSVELVLGSIAYHPYELFERRIYVSIFSFRNVSIGLLFFLIHWQYLWHLRSVRTIN